MKNAYLETSGIDYFLDSGIPAHNLREKLAHLGFRPAIGMLVLNECAQPILTGKPEITTASFQFIRDLSPSFCLPPNELHQAEARFLRKDTPIDPFYSGSNEDSVNHEVSQVASGLIHEDFMKLVEERSDTKHHRWKKWASGYLDAILELRRGDPNHAPRFRVFNQLEDYLSADFPTWIVNCCSIDITWDEAMLIAKDFKRFPAIRATVYYYLSALFIMLSDKTTPGKDKVDDWRHVVEASHCDAFVSNDSQLLRSISQLHASLEEIEANSLI